MTFNPIPSDGVATLSGTPDRGTGGTYPLTLRAANGALPDATQSFTLTVDEAPAITSANANALTVGTARTFMVKAKGYPNPSISIKTGALPSGVTLVNNGDGTATLSGTAHGARVAPIGSRSGPPTGSYPTPPSPLP